MPSKRVQIYPNNKPWVTPEIKALLNKKKQTFRSGDRAVLCSLQKELRLDIRRGKDIYKRTLEERLEQNNTNEVWRGLQNITGHGKEEGRNQVSGDKEWADKLNVFFPRFDSGTPPPIVLPATTSHLLGLPPPAPFVPHTFASHLPGPTPPPLPKTACPFHHPTYTLFHFPLIDS